MVTTEISRAVALDRRLFSICRSLQLTPSQYEKAEQRYMALSAALSHPQSPFSFIKTSVYSQGSMRLGTTNKPIDGPHDLDFVCELAIDYENADPMDLLEKLFVFFRDHGVYGGMAEKKNRCIRIVYKDDFYLDILPACIDAKSGDTCVQVPDKKTDWWKASDPIGYANWFERKTFGVVVTQFAENSRVVALDKAASVEPIPALEATGEKRVLQLVVQLLKRWRDVNYVDSSFPPISIVLTTLAADCYEGEIMVSEALLIILERIVGKLDAAKAAGRQLSVPNPVHLEEDFSERWKDIPRAYLEFDKGIRSLTTMWRNICFTDGNPDRDLETLFGDVVNRVRLSEARVFQTAREKGHIGIRTSGIVSSVASSSVKMLRNTNHGE